MGPKSLAVAQEVSTLRYQPCFVHSRAHVADMQHHLAAAGCRDESDRLRCVVACVTALGIVVFDAASYACNMRPLHLALLSLMLHPMHAT
jgi:hypothetical protein